MAVNVKLLDLVRDKFDNQQDFDLVRETHGTDVVLQYSLKRNSIGSVLGLQVESPRYVRVYDEGAIVFDSCGEHEKYTDQVVKSTIDDLIYNLQDEGAFGVYFVQAFQHRGGESLCLSDLVSGSCHI